MNKETLKILKRTMPKYNGWCDLCKNKKCPTLHYESVINNKHIYLCGKCYKKLKAITNKDKEED